MYKRLRNLFLVLCSVCLTLAVALFAAACTDNPDDETPDSKDPVTYTVSVSWGANESEGAQLMKFIQVTLYKTDGSAATEPTALSLDESGTLGTATFTLVPDEYNVELTGPLDNYQYAPEKLTATKTTAILVIVDKSGDLPGHDVESKTYTVKVLDPNDNPVSGAEVQLCVSAGQSTAGVCLNPVQTDENGIATKEASALYYDVHLLSYPKEYVFDNTKYQVGPEDPSIIVWLEDPVQYTVTVRYADGSPAPKETVTLYRYVTERDDRGSVFPTSTLQDEPNATGTTDAQGVAKLYGVADQFGQAVKLPDFEKDDLASRYEYGNPTIDPNSDAGNSATVIINGCGTDTRSPILIEEGENNVQFSEKHEGKGIFLAFSPINGKSGYYKATASANTNLYAKLYVANGRFVNEDFPEEEDRDGGNIEIKFCITAAEAKAGSGTLWVFKLTADTDAVFSFQFTVTRESIFDDDAPADGSREHPFPWGMNENTVSIPESDQQNGGVWYAFTPDRTAVYKFITVHRSAFVVDRFHRYFQDALAGEATAEMELFAGVRYLFNCDIAPNAQNISYTVTITRASVEGESGGNGSATDPYRINKAGWYCVETSRLSLGEYGKYFAFTPPMSGTWRIHITSAEATVIDYADSLGNAGTDCVRGRDDYELVITFEAGASPRYFFMGCTSESSTVYHFYLEKVL